MIKRILIVDDENLIRLSLSAALRQNDIHVTAVPCGKDALVEIDTFFYDLCFLDVNLPDMNGLYLMETIRKSSPVTKIIIMTGGVMDDPAAVQFIQENANLLISKPFDLKFVKLFVAGALGQGASPCHAEDHSCSRAGHETFEKQLMEQTRPTPQVQ